MAKVVSKSPPQRKLMIKSSAQQGPDSLLIEGDMLEVCTGLEPASFDFIYCDPPFATGRKHSSTRSQEHVFDDRWDSIEAYMGWLEPRVRAIHPLLCESGSFALHLDWHAVHYAKVLCDQIFGAERFVNEVIWAFRTGGASKRSLARKHDTILIYTKSKDYAFYPQKERSYLSHRYGFSNIEIHQDEQGYYRETLMRDVWELPALRGNQPEATGYPTQKPRALLDRLLECFTKEGDVVGDFCCGSGTTALSAHALGRRFICSDLSSSAIDLALKRFEDAADTE